MTFNIEPLVFEPVLRDYIWGGRNLEALYHRKLPPGIVAESWELSAHPSSPTRMAEGAWRGRTLPEVCAAWGEELVGHKNVQRSNVPLAFPLLVKLLDANQDLSVQVHPDDAYARAHERGDPGKTEMWYILHARPGAELIYGLARGATRASFRAAIAQGTLATQLHRLPVAAGDSVFIPAGMVHALLAGLVVAEIQQNSDTTYRVYDWGRLGVDGKPRTLHIEKALEVIDFDQVEPAKITPLPLAAPEGVARIGLVRCPQFTVERLTLATGAEFRGLCDGSTFEIWGCVEGASALHWAGAPHRLEAVGFILLPAALGAYTLRAEKSCTLLRTYRD